MNSAISYSRKQIAISLLINARRQWPQHSPITINARRKTR
jgi:hypothetical protein